MKSLFIWVLMTFSTMSMMLTSCVSVGEVDYTYDDDEEEESGSSSGSDGDEEAVSASAQEWIDEIMTERYLYNEEYAEMSGDTSLAYDDYLYDKLGRMESNILDRKVYEDWGVEEIFTYITRVANTKSSDSDSRMIVSYGAIYPYFAEIEIGRNESLIVLMFESLYPSSPLGDAGITRSEIFYMINNEAISASNASTFESMIYYPSLGDELVLKSLWDDKEYTITASYMLPSPIIESDIIEKSGGVKVGYLNLSSFDLDYTSELLDVLEEFSEAQITDFILDLRCNLGGDIDITNVLCSCIASITSQTPIFYHRYNANMTSYYAAKDPGETDLYYDDESGLFCEYAYNDPSLQSSHLTALSDKTIYCLVSFNSASASELTINSLRGWGYDVVLIGSDTRGKNVGSIESSKSIDSYTYYLSPIMVQLYNAELFGDYESGFTPESDNLMYESIPFVDYGEGEDLFDRAIELITGTPSLRSTSVDSTTSNSVIVNSQPFIATPHPATPHGSIVRER